jgi:hypothetical protein
MKVISLIFILLLSACASHQVEVIDPIKDPIRFGLHSKRDEYRSCFLESESYKGRNSNTDGVVMAGFTINKLGVPTEIKILESPFKDPNFHACLQGIIGLIRFPPSKDGGYTTVTQPISFSAVPN